jgi:transcriptional regulator with XRE-family HTH domain
MQALREFRIERGMSQAQLAERAGCTPSHVSLVESGKRSPSIATLRRLSEALLVEPGRLLVGAR